MDKNIFICQISETHVKVVKAVDRAGKNAFSPGGDKKPLITAAESAELAKALDDAGIIEVMAKVFRKLGYRSQPIVISLPRSFSTCRLLKVPSVDYSEIENIVKLQAQQYLPYQQEELVTGYEIISTEKEGYALIYLVVLQKAVVERCLRLVETMRPRHVDVVLSSYGLQSLQHFFYPQKRDTVMLIDFDMQDAEVVVVWEGKIVFSRAFKINRNDHDWLNLCAQELKRSYELYSKERPGEKITRCLLLSQHSSKDEITDILSRRLELTVEPLLFLKEGIAAAGVAEFIEHCGVSFAEPIGIAVEPLGRSLSLLPQGIKEQKKARGLSALRLRQMVVLLVIIALALVGMRKNIGNKEKYLLSLNRQLQTLSNEARVLDGLDKRLQFAQGQNKADKAAVGIICEIFRIIPPGINLLHLDYEPGRQLVIRGQTQELDSVFMLGSLLEGADLLKQFSPKVRYATKKKTFSGECIEFEIGSARK